MLLDKSIAFPCPEEKPAFLLPSYYLSKLKVAQWLSEQLLLLRGGCRWESCFQAAEERCLDGTGRAETCMGTAGMREHFCLQGGARMEKHNLLLPFDG